MMVRVIVERIIEGNKRYIEAAGLKTESKPTSNIVTGSLFKPDWSALKRLLIASAAMREKIPYIDGLPVYADNCYYGSGNGKASATTSNNNYFLTGVFDTGSTGSKSYSVGGLSGGTGGVGIYLRLFNDLDGTSVDNWIIKDRTMTTSGQFIIFSVYKPSAASVYMYDSTNSRYIFKGSSVT